jgi:hypothetical protein
MPQTLFLVRAVVAPHLREKFDHWYSADHLPWAIEVFKCEKAWRYWSSIDRNVHYAVYQFADELSMDLATTPDNLKPLIDDFDRNWPTGVARTRDKLVLAGQRGN